MLFRSAWVEARGDKYSPSQVSAFILQKMKETAESYLGETVDKAVITVPAYFNDAQRKATKEAGTIAGLEVKRILNEPTAASLAYGMENARSQTILVVDLGGGTFDVSVLEVGDGVFEVRSTSGDTQLGGNDFDKKIVDWLAEAFLERVGVDLRRDRQSLQRLNEAAEKAKIELSGVGITDINLPFITATEEGPQHIETRLARGEFESMCDDLVRRLRIPIKQAVLDAELHPRDIDEVVLVGGSTRMPMVQNLVEALIRKQAKQNVNPDEVVAVGAAIQAGILEGEVSDVLLLDVTPLSVGLETIGGVMKKLIPRNTTIPVRRSDVFSTSENNQSQVEVHVAQGEREMAEDNKSLGRFKLSGIPPAPRGIPQVQVSFDIDANGILQVSALDRSTGREQSVTIQGASTLTEQEIGQAIQQAEDFADDDRLRREKIDRRNRAEALATRAERELRSVALDFGLQFAQGQRRRIDILVQELRDSLSRNDERGIDLNSASLQDAMYELNREVSEFLGEEDEGIFESIRKTFSGDDDPNFGFEERPSRMGRPSYDERPYDNGGYGLPTRPPRRDRPAGRLDDRSRPSRIGRTNAYDEDWGDEDDWF